MRRRRGVLVRRRDEDIPPRHSKQIERAPPAEERRHQSRTPYARTADTRPVTKPQRQNAPPKKSARDSDRWRKKH